MLLEFKKSSKGQDQLLLENCVFSKERVRSNKVYWKCQFYKSLRCPSRAVTNDNELISCTVHNHNLTKPETLKKDITSYANSMDEFKGNGQQQHDSSEKKKERSLNNMGFFHNQPVNSCKQYSDVQEAIKLKANILQKRIDQDRSQILKICNKRNGFLLNQDISKVISTWKESGKKKENKNISSDELNREKPCMQSRRLKPSEEEGIESSKEYDNGVSKDETSQTSLGEFNVKPCQTSEEYYAKFSDVSSEPNESDKDEDIVSNLYDSDESTLSPQKQDRPDLFSETSDESTEQNYSKCNNSREIKTKKYIRQHKNLKKTADKVSDLDGVPRYKKFRIDAMIDYMKWDDPNQLVDRLRMLVATLPSNLSNFSEIQSILVELNIAGYIEYY